MIYTSFLDKNSEIINNKISGDGTHLNGEGYETWVEVIEEYVNSNWVAHYFIGKTDIIVFAKNKERDL